MIYNAHHVNRNYCKNANIKKLIEYIKKYNIYNSDVCTYW